MPENTTRLSTALADRSKIERHLGEGGMATVYLAEDLKRHRKVAVRTGFLERVLDEKDHAMGRTGWLGHLWPIVVAGTLVTACAETVSVPGSEVFCGVPHNTSTVGLVGRWVLLRSCGGIGGGCSAPTLDRCSALWITVDSMLRIYVADTVFFEASFSVRQQSTSFGDSVIVIGGNPFWAFELPAPDSLVLRDVSFDGFTHQYRRR